MRKAGILLQKMKEYLLAVFYPARCPVCERLTGGRRIRCCPICEEKLPYIPEPRCLKCGKAVTAEETEYCMDCTKQQHVFTRGIALWSFDRSVRRVVYRFKYKNRREYAEYFAREIVKCYGRQIKSWNAEALVPVPIHRKRYKKRGFNQAELLAKEIGRYMKLEVHTEIISRIRNTRPQKELNNKERQKNLKSAFKINQNSVKLKKVIVVDDIYTTGATVDVMTELLLQTEITHVYVITLCIGRGY